MSRLSPEMDRGFESDASQRSGVSMDDVSFLSTTQRSGSEDLDMTQSHSHSIFKPEGVQVHDLAWRIRHLVIYFWLSIFEQAAMGPTALFASISFLSPKSVDCAEVPRSMPCRKGAAELAFVSGLLGAAAHSVAWLAAFSLGTMSDWLGRRPLVRAKAVSDLLPVVAFVLHLEAGVSLWPFFFFDAAKIVLDINGVWLAMLTDVVPDSKDRSLVFGLGLAMLLIGVAPAFAIGGWLPSEQAVCCAAAAGVLKVVFVFVAFPESTTLDPLEGEVPGPCQLLEAARQMFQQKRHMIRLAIILLLAGIALSGIHVIQKPIFTGFIGMHKGELAKLHIIFVISCLAALMGVLPLILHRFGEVRSLQLSLVAVACYPLGLGLCSSQFEAMILGLLVFGPMHLFLPLASGIKSHLVEHRDAGMVMGVLASIRVLAVAVADLGFGWLYRHFAGRGDPDHTVVMWLLGSLTAFALAALGASLLLPKGESRSAGDEEGTEMNLDQSMLE